jgi:3-deoxy-D-manno-octulosonate 8-phosphate phosphatase (KDO 8-P phosphatase)
MIKLIVLDIDGTLSDGHIYYSKDGEVIKAFNVQDGLAIAFWVKELKNDAVVISGRVSPIVAKRLNDLGIYEIYEGIKDKKKLLLEIMEKKGLKKHEVSAIGDDVNDLAMLKMLSFSFAPKNANFLILENVNNICPQKGGKGAVRYMIEYLLKHNNEWEVFLNKWS